MVKDGGGTAELTTVAGGKLTVMRKGNKLWIKDSKGGVSQITIKDVNQSNGVIHVIR
ncbi:MAG: fasciclin domain-containing protein [Chitinophagaceae bacterium]